MDKIIQREEVKYYLFLAVLVIYKKDRGRKVF